MTSKLSLNFMEDFSSMYSVPLSSFQFADHNFPFPQSPKDKYLDQGKLLSSSACEVNVAHMPRCKNIKILRIK